MNTVSRPSIRVWLPRIVFILVIIGILLPSQGAWAAGSNVMLTRSGDGENWSLPVQTLVLLTSLTFLPAILLMMTGFTRVIIVLGLLRNALGTPSTPPNQVLLGLALFLTFYVMSPVFNEIYKDAWQPLSEDKISMETALERGVQPLRTFMLAQTRETDLALYTRMAKEENFQSREEVPLRILLPAFVTSELKTGFQIGFTVFIPFLIIDLVVASVLMALGMMMVPPATISLPFKLMLFVLVDGWQLLMGSLAQSFFS
ncbi:flagellar type III secretion system pore protein FliP [Yersinia sp. 2105 StPb PI]|uniref:flagellar type III secretion system pore protein FliP n=2 Tax=Yersinia sp. 2105 StPb PI TaxID=2507058 RepID=UPI000FFC2F17|nr:flagellar biosynthesis protein FliP [Yersinia sp. 2105 StPb PI]